MSIPEAKQPKPLRVNELRQLLHEAIDAGLYCGYETIHARFDNVERKIDLNDVLHGLKRTDWTLKHTPEFNTEFWQWKYTVTTKDIEGEPVGIVVAVDTKGRSFEVITRWRINR
jgi:hypothetical protein